ncbi:MAG: tetratricopeptide repeat protein [Gemmatimonadaceae bacterium]|nr:tetratricopeptide repeat protein [Gemmatimonadaceae bacterium]
MPIDRTLLQGASMLAQSALRGSRELPPFPSDLRRLLGAALRELPPQWFEVGRYQNSGIWIELAALIEAAGLFDEAWDLLSAMADVISSHPTARGERSSPSDDLEAATLRSFLWARRGRVSRMAGRLDNAEACYGEALAGPELHARPAFWSDVYPWAWIGRAVLAVERGNYPAARTFALKALDTRVPSGHQAQAHVMLALFDRKRQRHDRALHHLWSAHDLSDNHPVHQAEILVALGEVALQLGDTCAAIRAWRAVLSLNRTPRMVAPAVVGLMDAMASQYQGGDPCGECSSLIARSTWFVQPSESRGDVPRRMASLVGRLCNHESLPALIAGELARHDTVELQLARARLLFTIGETSAAIGLASSLRADAVQLGFHERVFQIDALLANSGIDQSAPTAIGQKRRALTSQVQADLARCFVLDAEAQGERGALV